MQYAFGYQPFTTSKAVDEYSAFALHRITAFDITSGTRAGYLTITYIPSGSFNKSIIPFLELHGKLYGRRCYKTGIRLTDDELMVKDSWSLITELPMPYLEKNDLHKELNELPVNVAAKRIRKEILPQIEKRYKKAWQEDIDYHVNCPRVDFIRVENEFRGTGLAEQLYYRGAKWMKDSFGLPFRFSTLQSEKAQRVMQRFIERKMVTQTQSGKYTFNWLNTDNSLWLDNVA